MEMGRVNPHVTKTSTAPMAAALSWSLVLAAVTYTIHNRFINDYVKEQESSTFSSIDTMPVSGISSLDTLSSHGCFPHR